MIKENIFVHVSGRASFFFLFGCKSLIVKRREKYVTNFEQTPILNVRAVRRKGEETSVQPGS